MKSHSERGVALVITLIMLALVTFMAVVFLAISRREKASVTVQGDMSTAHLMADAALARAESEIASRFLTSTNPFGFDLLVSTNFYNTNGFQRNWASPQNVNYDHVGNPNGAPLQANTQDWLQNIANLQYDPRAPVFVLTNQNSAKPYDFRYWLDLNRNGRFEPTGLYTPGFFGVSAREGTNYYVGDPQWIGVLEHPDMPHGESNQFIGRYIFVVVPTGHSLDVNTIHNAAKRLTLNMSSDGYFRNQGVGAWEINLAGFLRGLNTNIWDYEYNPDPRFRSTGYAFEDATTLLRHRYNGFLGSLPTARVMFNFASPTLNPFTESSIDYYANGPLYTNGPLVNLALNNVNQPWSGSDNTNGFYNISELFDPNKTSSNFVTRLTYRPTVSNSPYDRYTFYRMLAQLGTDSQAPESNKVYFSDYQLHDTNRLHLNYWNLAPNGQTNFIPWTPTTFFTNAADRLLRASLNPLVLTNGNRLQTNFLLGASPVRNVFSLTNIQLYSTWAGKTGIAFDTTNTEYTATTHRLLQLAANIREATTNTFFPAVFRPVFYRSATNLTIRGYVEETNTAFLNYPWMSIQEAVGVPPFAAKLAANTLYTNVNLEGVPVIIGAKKHFPSFNKLVMQTVATVTRRLELRKSSPGLPPNQTNQMYMIGISNRFAVEGWNSYSNVFPNAVKLMVSIESRMGLHHEIEGNTLESIPYLTNWFSTNITTTVANWAGWSNMASTASFMVPLDTNIAALANNTVYIAHLGAFTNFGPNLFERSFRVPNWYLMVTNRLRYIAVDTSINPNRVIDLVNLDNLITRVDLSRGLTGDTNAGGGGIFSDKGKGTTAPGGRGAAPVTDGDLWNPQHMTASLDSPTRGVMSQIAVSEGNPYVGEGTWRNSSGQIGDKDTAIRQFTDFMAGRTTNLTMQSPFTPYRRLYQKSSWEANDPLVHYTAGDLTDPASLNQTNLLVRPIDLAFDTTKDAMLRQPNSRYRPWGGNPNKTANNDPTANNLTYKDPLVRRSDDWQFPTNRFPNLGWLGRVHRGTPWQTVYLKAAIDPTTGQPLDINSWQQWSGSYGTHPTNDWKLLDLFTVAPNDNAARGVLGVNETNYASWAAVLSGVAVTTNTYPDGAVSPTRRPLFSYTFVNPDSWQLRALVAGITRTKGQQPNRAFRTVGDILAVPELTVYSPFLRLTPKQLQNGLDDAAYERIPQQVLSLLRTDEPRVTIYAYGQSLRPADRSLVTAAGYFNLCTNYQVTGEFAAKAVVRLDDLPPQVVSSNPRAPAAQRLRAVVESYQVLPSD